MSTDLPPNKPSRKQQDDGWSFDFRTPLHYADSDDSDQEDGPSAPALATVSSEAKLLKDMDLSTREETVAYKPNPFSIAKINASYRSKAPSKQAKPTHNAPNAKTLAEGFEVQKKRALLPSRAVPLASQITVSNSTAPTKEQIPAKLTTPPLQLLAAFSSKTVQPVFHDSLKENCHKASQSAHILTNDRSRTGSTSVFLSLLASISPEYRASHFDFLRQGLSAQLQE
ncbi:hypothetical protein BJ912DRAFT_1002828 [Pholiota molesta]|nr:hypothetical protein BJ912DRAFT_1002828 [Pholiota molesta]